MCVLYRGSNYIPESRLNLYEECARLLFIKWDRSRDIAVPLELGPDIDAALMHLAYWIMTEGRFAGGVTETELIGQCADYLRQRRYEDNVEARRVAAEFVGFCRGRAWVLAEAGTSSGGELLYTFTHRTFLEYYAAFHLSRTCGSPEAIGTELAPRLAESEWDVVGQLAVQMANKYHDLGADRVLNTLMDHADTAGALEKTAIVLFAASALLYVIPAPPTVRRITAASFALMMQKSAGAETARADLLGMTSTPLEFALGALPASRGVIADEMSAQVHAALSNGATPDDLAARAYAACALAFTLAEPPDSRKLETYLFWKAWSLEALDRETWSDRLHSDPGTAAMGALEAGKLSIDSFLAKHDPRVLFDGPRDGGLNVFRVGTLGLLAGWLRGYFSEYLFSPAIVNSLLQQLPAALRAEGLPLSVPPPGWSSITLSPMPDRMLQVEAESIGGGVLLLCMELEGHLDTMRKLVLRSPDSAHRAIRLTHSLAMVRVARSSGAARELDPDSAAFIWLLDDGARQQLTDWSELRTSFWRLADTNDTDAQPGLVNAEPGPGA
jgi:hypothetical protein